jgi:PAS domain S-box-containing protein
MQAVKGDTSLCSATQERAKTLFRERQSEIYKQTDRLFARLMVAQWLVGIGLAFWLSPLTWSGSSSHLHVHVWAAIIIGGLLAAVPVWLAWDEPGTPTTRYSIAICQMLFSALLIHLTGGRIETHFHVFGSLVFLSLYRDLRVLVIATLVVLIDHITRGLFLPQSVYGVLAASPWRSIEHAAWVMFEDTFLFISVRDSLKEMNDVSTRQARLERMNSEIKHQMGASNTELDRERELLYTLLDKSPDYIYFKDLDSKFLRCSRTLAEQFGLTPDQVVGKSDFDFYTEDHARPAFDDEQRIIKTGEPLVGKVEKEFHKKSDRISWALTNKLPLRNNLGEIIGTFGISKDITAMKEAEERLDEVHKQLLETSRQAGMAEVATGVLHNVGNVLNSVNVSANLVSDKLKKSKAPNVSRIAALMKEHTSDLGNFMANDPKGKQIPGFLAELGNHLQSEQTIVLQEVAGLCKNIEHIKDIVAMQQTYSKVCGVAEIVQVTDLVEDALRMNTGALARHDVQLVREYDPQPVKISVEKHKVLQILVNLIRNAKYACDESGRKDKKLIVRVTNEPEKVKISVKDNGIGIPQENLTRIFSHGFTTKKDGHGFGLHSGALSAKELGGSLQVHSDGPNQGAMFTLELPLSQKEKEKG